MLIVIFLLLIVLGIYQMNLQRKQQEKNKQFLRLANDQQTTNRLEARLTKYDFGQTLISGFKDYVHYLKGEDRETGIKHLIIMFIVLAVVYYFNSTSLELNTPLVLSVVALLTSYFLYIASKKKARTQFEESFAEALAIIGSAVSVGNTVIAGIEQCAVKLEGTRIGDVFKRVHQRIEIGEDVETVLLDTYNELNYREYFFFIVAIVINMKGGGQIKEIMSRLSQIISNGRIMDKKKYAKTSEARMSVKILAIMPVAMFFMLKLISPENFTILVSTSGGHIILGYAIVSTMLGLAITWSMMNKV